MTPNKRLKNMLIFVAVILLIPLMAMQFTEEVNWELTDFIVAGVLLLGTGLVCEFVMRKVKKAAGSAKHDKEPVSVNGKVSYGKKLRMHKAKFR